MHPTMHQLIHFPTCNSLKLIGHLHNKYFYYSSFILECLIPTAKNQKLLGHHRDSMYFCKLFALNLKNQNSTRRWRPFTKRLTQKLHCWQYILTIFLLSVPRLLENANGNHFNPVLPFEANQVKVINEFNVIIRSRSLKSI